MKEEKTTRNMHYLPQAYLKQFAAAPSKKSKLHVFDLRQDRWFATVPRNVGARRDFLKVDIPGQPPDMMENILSPFEARVDVILTTMRETQVMPDGEDYGHLMGLIALFGIRNPMVRANINRFTSQVMDRMAYQQVATKERYEQGVQDVQKAGRAPGPVVPYEEMRDFVLSGQYNVKISNTFNVTNELYIWPTITDLLLRRKWTLAIATKGSHFVSSDHPTSLAWSNPERDRGFYPPGYATKNTEVVFPLMKEMALIGAFEGTNRVAHVPPYFVASINSRVISYTECQIYSSRPEFQFVAGNNQVYPSGRLKDFLPRQPRPEQDAPQGKV